MIYIKLELWPGGNQKRAQTLCEGLIANIGGTRKLGSYIYKLSKVGGFKGTVQDIATGEVKNVLRSGRVENFPRLRLDATDLFLRVLCDAFGSRNPGAGAVQFDHEVLNYSPEDEKAEPLLTEPGTLRVNGGHAQSDPASGGWGP